MASEQPEVWAPSWRAYQQTDNYYTERLYWVRCMNATGSCVLGRELTFKTAGEALQARDLLNHLSVIPRGGNRPTNEKEEKMLRLIETEPSKRLVLDVAILP